MDKYEEYHQHFHKGFPFMEVMGLTDKEIAELIDKCIADNKEYKSEYRKGLLY